MKSDSNYAPPAAPGQYDPDRSSDLRIFASWMGLILVAFGTAMAGYMFYRIGMVILDPRSFETQVDRWEFVIRGRTTDAFPGAYETPEQTLRAPAIEPDGSPAVGEPDADSPPSTTYTEADPTEEMARLIGRVGSKSARPAALLLIILVLTILVRIIIAIIHAGIRLAGLAGGEREYMKRIINELVNQRNRD